MSKPKLYNCKVGTIPATIMILGRPNIKVGARIKFRLERDIPNVGQYTHGIIDQINPDGYFFVSMN